MLAIEQKLAGKENRSPYRQFEIGQPLNFPLHTLSPDGTVITNYEEGVIESIKGGGFFGKVLILREKGYVIKTSIPDAWHDLWRRVNWGFEDFPSQVDKTQAQLDHLVTNLIADVLPNVTGGRFYAPRSLGYTKLSNGYAQVVEKMHGRPPRYDRDADEYLEFRKAQKELRQTAYDLGLEQAAQIHENNPFGMANLWKDPERNSWIWLDTLPAIPHKGWVWPLFNFRFHRDVREWFYPDNPKTVTFNRIHPDLFLKEITRHVYKFDPEAYQKILDNLTLYRSLWGVKSKERNKNLKGAATAFVESGSDFASKAKEKTISAVTSPFKVIFDADYRRTVVLEGAKEAHAQNIISENELNEAEQTVDLKYLTPNQARRRFLAWASLPIFYTSCSLGLKSSEAITYLSVIGGEGWEQLQTLGLSYLLSQDLIDKAPQLALMFTMFRLLPSVVRPVGTKLIGDVLNVDLKVAAIISAIPALGQHLALPAQIGVAFGNRSELVWHYSLRNTLAKLSSFSPAGGWGTQLEGQLWNRLGRHLENLADRKREVSQPQILES